MAGVSELPLLHKYVIRPHDDLRLVMTKLNYRLCVKQVSQVNYRRSLGSSISEAIDICELAPDSPVCAAIMTSTTSPTSEVEPLVFSDDPEFLSSPKQLSPVDSSYCGTMKSDDSGIVMDDSHNFSMTSSDHEPDAELNFTSAEASPLEEENDFIHDCSRDASVSPQSVEELPVQVEEVETSDLHDTVRDFFNNSGPFEEHAWEGQEDMQTEYEEAEQHYTEQLQHNGDIHQDTRENTGSTDETGTDYYDVTSSQHNSMITEESTEQEDLPQCIGSDKQPLEAEAEEMVPEVEEELIEQQTAEEREELSADLLQDGDQKPEPEDDRVDFVKETEPEGPLFDHGIKCDDVYTALDILKTRYRLSDTSVIRKFVITFSSWDVSQLSHPMNVSNRSSWWADETKEEEDEEEVKVEDLMEQIYSRQGEISDLVDHIMEQEADKIRAQQALVEAASKPAMSSPSNNTGSSYPTDVITPCHDDVITPCTQTLSQSTPVDSYTPAPPPLGKKKNRNALQRFVNAMRKRIRRNRPQSQSQSTRKTT